MLLFSSQWTAWLPTPLLQRPARERIFIYVISQGWRKHHLLDLLTLFRPALQVRLVERFTRAETETIVTQMRTVWGKRVNLIDEVEVSHSG